MQTLAVYYEPPLSALRETSKSYIGDRTYLMYALPHRRTHDHEDNQRLSKSINDSLTLPNVDNGNTAMSDFQTADHRHHKKGDAAGNRCQDQRRARTQTTNGSRIG